MKKRSVLIAAVSLLGLSVSVGAFTHKIVSAKLMPQEINYNGITLNQQVLVYDNTTYVPLRDLSELLGIPLTYTNGIISLGDSSKTPTSTVSTSTVSTSTSTSTVPTSSISTSKTTNNLTAYITESTAKTIALQHADVQESNVTITELKLERDDYDFIYEVEFFKGTKEYDYEINALTGTIISYDYDTEEPETLLPITNGHYIRETQAENIALDHAGLTNFQVSAFESELDEDDGIWEYQIEFKHGNTEYEYDIHAYTGEILDYDIDFDK